MLDDADFAKQIPTFMGQLVGNTGQAAHTLSRMLTPCGKYQGAVGIATNHMGNVKPGKPNDPQARIGPLVTEAEWNRPHRYFKKGIEKGAWVLTGGLGKPDELEDGSVVKPTVFADTNNKMTTT